MKLKEIIKKCSGLRISEERLISDEYVELVFYSKDLNEWDKILSEVLGLAVKLAGARPTRPDLHLTRSFGAIYDNQTLFKKEQDDATVAAMFWPWQDGEHVTLKIFLFKK